MSKNEIEKIFIEFLKKTTIHNINSIRIANNTFLRIIWIISLILSATLCGYSIIISINDYLSYEVMTKIREINELKSVFPTVSICNRNMFTSKKAYDYLKNYAKLKNLTTDLLHNPSLDILQSNSFLRSAISNFIYLEKTNLERKELSYDLKEVMLSCSYNRKACDENDFEWFYHFTYGNCYKFNPIRKFGNENIIPGKLYGLSLEMNIGLYNGLDSIRDTRGLSLIVSNSSDFVNYLDGIFLFSSTENDITVKRKFSELLPNPFSSCQDINTHNSKMIKFILEKNYKYSFRLCMNVCLQKQIARKCRCYDSSSIPIDNYPVCYQDADFLCLSKLYNNISEFIATNDDCYNECPFECDKSELVTSMVISRYPFSNYYADKLVPRLRIINPNFTINDVWENVLKLNVFYESLTYTSITETAAMSLGVLLSNIGGTLGLFLGKNFKFLNIDLDLKLIKNPKGVSLLTFVEVLELFLIILLVIIKTIRKKSFNLKKENQQ